MDTATLERVVTLVALGLVSALRAKRLTIDEANHLLFSPHTMGLLRSAGAREALVALVQRGSELEDLASLLPDSLDGELESLEQAALSCLAETGRYDFSVEKWLDALALRALNGEAH